MKYLILIAVLVLIGCGEVTFEVDSDSRVEDVVLSDESGVIEMGSLPFTVTSRKREVLTVKFNSKSTNFAVNHTQCDCEELPYYYKCTETFEVNGTDWNIAE